MAAVTNYALYPILTRILNSQNFGDFAVVSSLSNQLLGMFLAINIMSIYLVKALPEKKAREHIEAIQKALLQLFAFVTVIVLILSPFIQESLKIQELSSLVLLGLILFSAIPATVWTGYLQGHKELVRIGIFNLGSALVKVLLTSLLANAYGTTGAIIGVVVSGVVGLLILRSGVGVQLPSLQTVFKRPNRTEFARLRTVGSFLVQCLFVVGVFSLLQNFDITLAKHLFSPETAGVYSGVSILSNSLYYLAFLVVWIILPEISLENHKINRRVLSTAYALLGLLAVGSLSFTYIFRMKITSFLLGTQFEGQGQVLLLAIVYQLLLAGIALYAFYLLTIRSKDSIVLAAAIGLITFVVPLNFADNPQAMIRLLSTSLLAGLSLYTVYKVSLSSS